MRLDDEMLEATPEEGARLLALGLLSEAEEEARKLAAGEGEDPLHDFRVAVRRLRSALRAYRPWLEESVRPRLEKRVRACARDTNAARDAEVQLAWLRPKAEGIPARHRRGVEAMIRRFEEAAAGSPAPRQVAERFARVAGKLRRRLGTYERRVEDGTTPETRFEAVLATLARDELGALRTKVDAIAAAGDQPHAHQARIAGKRLRYLLEPLRGYRHGDAAGVVKHLKRLQDVLGDLHDSHVFSAAIRDALVDAAAERARRLHAALSGDGANVGTLRDALRDDARPGLLELTRQVRERRDALYADVEREWRAGGLDALAAEIEALAAALEARAGGKLERERKYLLAAVPPRAAEQPAIDIAQGWLPGARVRERIRRVRDADGERYWRGLKQGAGQLRLETEEETTRAVFEALWPLTEGHRVTKRRRRIADGLLVWNIDELVERGVVVAEVELPARATAVSPPEWIRPLVVREVTDDPDYLDENLAGAPAAVGGASRAEPAGTG